MKGFVDSRSFELPGGTTLPVTIVVFRAGRVLCARAAYTTSFPLPPNVNAFSCDFLLIGPDNRRSIRIHRSSCGENRKPKRLRRIILVLSPQSLKSDADCLEHVPCHLSIAPYIRASIHFIPRTASTCAVGEMTNVVPSLRLSGTYMHWLYDSVW